jgi:hypothetical protein
VGWQACEVEFLQRGGKSGAETVSINAGQLKLPHSNGRSNAEMKVSQEIA